MNKLDPLSVLDKELLAPELTEEEKALRDLFVLEYVKDFDPVNACLRLGLQLPYAEEWARRFMEESYVQQQISHVTGYRRLSEEEVKAKDKELILTTLRMAMQAGPHASRVSAAKQMAIMHGFDRAEIEDGTKALIDVFKDIAVGMAQQDRKDGSQG